MTGLFRSRVKKKITGLTVTLFKRDSLTKTNGYNPFGTTDQLPELETQSDLSSSAKFHTNHLAWIDVLPPPHPPSPYLKTNEACLWSVLFIGSVSYVGQRLVCLTPSDPPRHGLSVCPFLQFSTLEQNPAHDSSKNDGSSTLKPQAVIFSWTMVLHPEYGGQEFRPEDLKTQMQFILK